MTCGRELLVTDHRFATTGDGGTRVKAAVWLRYVCTLPVGHGSLHTCTAGGGGFVEWTAMDPYYEQQQKDRP